MRRNWTEAGACGLNLIVVILVIVATQLLLLQKHRPSLVGGAIQAALVMLAYIVGSKWIEHRTLSDLDVKRLLPEIAAGIVAGFALFASCVAILWVAGVYHVVGGGAANGLAKGLVAALATGIIEETLFRGLLFRLSAKILGTWGALLFTAALFGAAHAFNRGATVGSSLAIAIEAGILLGAAYAATQRLWLPIGLHVGWNFTEGSIFSMAVSGGSAGPGLIHGSLTGPQILTGGEFGPEASIVAVLVCGAAALYLVRRTVARRRNEPPVWNTAQA